jgi:hypothetical protein
MKVKRYEILLPLRYNDQTLVGKEKFFETEEALINQFGAISVDWVVVSGKWVYESVTYHDRLIRIRIDIPDNSANRTFIKKFKQTLKKRFKQKDIWITVQDLKII